MKAKSKGHICFSGNFEFYERGGEVFRAHVTNVLDTSGYRHGRWECSKAHFERFKNLFPYFVCYNVKRRWKQ